MLDKRISNLLAGLCLLLISLGSARAQQLMVFPGDVNNNGVVNNVDALYLGIAHNHFGPARDPNLQSPNPGPVNANPWNQQFANGLNFAYADCNGDGYIHYLTDLSTILSQYGETNPNNVDPEVFTAGIEGVDPPLQFNTDNVSTTQIQGSSFSLPIMLGTEDHPADDLYGIAFSIFTDGHYIRADETEVHLSDSTWANPDNDYFYMYQARSDQRLDIAWTRTDQNMKNGYGPIGKADFIIIIDVIGMQEEITIHIDSIKMLDKYGNETTVAGDTVTITVLPDASNVGQKTPEKYQGKIFPNPASETLCIQGKQSIQEIVFIDPLGREVLHHKTIGRDHYIPVGHLPSGAYKMLLKTRNTLYTELIIIE